MVDPNCDLTFNIDKKMVTSPVLTPEINIKKHIAFELTGFLIHECLSLSLNLLKLFSSR